MTSAELTSDEILIRSLIDDRLDAMRSGDACRFVASFDSSVVRFDVALPLQSAGREAIDPDGLQSWLDTWTADFRVELADVVIAVDGTVAFCHCLEHFQGTRASGEREAFWTRSTVGLRKIGGTWMITHEHSSIPIPMDEQDES